MARHHHPVVQSYIFHIFLVWLSVTKLPHTHRSIVIKIEEKFSLFVVFGYFWDKRKTVMERRTSTELFFADTLQDFNNLRYAGHIVHILCCGGNMGFTFQDTRYNIAVGDYVILPNGDSVLSFQYPTIFKVFWMTFRKPLSPLSLSVAITAL